MPLTQLVHSAEHAPLPVKDRFVEIYGSTMVLNSYLKIAVASLALVCIGLVVLNVKLFAAFSEVKPLVIRINEVGRAEAIQYSSLEYRPQEAEIRYFLMQFVSQHYSRIRRTVQENFLRSLQFLDARLAQSVMDLNDKNKMLESFLSGNSEEIEIEVRNVSLEDLRKPPYRATVDYDKVYVSPASRLELRRERFVGHFVFVVKDRVPNTLVPVNPLGLTITYFREDQAFQ